MKEDILPFSAFLVTLALLVPTQAAEPRRPNILIFLADDLGYADMGVNGCKDIPTPNVDSLAVNGVRFTNGYATHCVCSPSRAGLMSGRYQHRYGFEHNSGPDQYAAENFGLPRSETTLAERLQQAGYATGMVGKWHIGFKEGLRPHERGFDFHFGFLGGAHTYLPGQRAMGPLLKNGVPVEESEYLTDAFAREAVTFIDRSQTRPWFLYVAFNAVHLPLDKNEYMEKFPNLTGDRRTYAGMLSALDTAVGRVLAKVRAIGQEENTLVFFYSDNGGPTPQTTSRNEPLRGYKAQFYEGGIRVPFLAQWKGKLPADKTFTSPVMGFDCHATALAAAGIELPKDKPLDGVNLLPYLNGEKNGRPHEQLFWRAGETHAARVGDWKLLLERSGGTQLFNLASDIGERNNLSDQEPAKLKELQAAYDAWEKEMESPRWVRQDAANLEPGAAKKTKAGSVAARLEQAFKAADKNGDGRLTAAEYPQPQLFKDVDQNGDGVATLEEVRAYYATRRGQPEKK